MTDRPTAQQGAPAPLALVPVPGLQAIGGDAVGLCGPDGCYPAGADAGPTDLDTHADPAPARDGRPAHAASTDRLP